MLLFITVNVLNTGPEIELLRSLSRSSTTVEPDDK